MPRISSLATAASTLQAACDLVGEANGLNSLSSLSRMKSYSGFGEGVCTCARCMRRAGPIREDVENKLVQITYALANVYDDSPDLDVRVTEEHRTRAEEMMGCVESGDVIRLREIFLEVEDWEAEGVLEPGTAPEIATYLIISAAQVGQPEIIRLLAEWDADMEETDSIRRGRPLMHAANNGHTSAVKALVECGADPEATDDNGYTALMVAVFSDRSSAAEALLEGGAQVDTPDRAGRTALSYAAMYGSTDCIYLLAARGADVGHVDADGNTPLELAEGSGRQSAVDALKKLQLRVKMQEKRKVKQSRTRGGCAELDAAELRAKEQEAARAAAELLEQLEKEEAARAAAKAAAGSASAKKKKKGKSKISLLEQDAADSVQDGSADAVPAQQHTPHHQQQQHAQGQQAPGVQQQQLQPSKGGSGQWSATPEQRSSKDDASKSSTADAGSHTPKQQHARQAQDGPQRLASKGSSEVQQLLHREAAATHGADQQLAPGTPGGASVSAADGGGSGSELFGDEGGELLRREWEALLEAAARCKDAAQQPQMLARVVEMLPRCAEAGISVKYGRKVLQRLQAVGPARKALTAALAARSPRLPELEEALGAAKVCRCLLEDELLQRAETKLAVLQQQLQKQQQAEEQARLQQQQREEQLRLQQQRAEEARQQQHRQQQRERELQRQRELDAQRKQQETLRQQQLEQEQLRKHQQEQEQQLQQQEREQARQKQEAAARLAWEQRQRLQADQAAIAAAAAAGAPAAGPRDDPISPRLPGRPQPAVEPPRPQQVQQLVPEDPELPPQQLPSRQQQLQQLQQQLQQQQPQQPLSPHGLSLSAQQQGPGLFQQQQRHLQQQSRLSMLAAQQPQQLVGSLQQQALQSLHGASSSALLTQQQQQERQLAMQLLEQAAAAQTAISSALPAGPSLQESQLQQQQALNQLQLLHQQRMFAAQLQGQAGGAAGLAPMGSGGLLGAGSGQGLQGPLLGSGSLGSGLMAGTQQGLPQSSQGLPPGGQLSQLQRQQQQQHLASSLWGAAGAADALVSPGGYGSVGQPVPGRLSAELQGPPVGPLGLAGQGSARADVGRAGGGLGAAGVALRQARGPGLGAGAGLRGVEPDMLDDEQHPAFSMAHAVLDDDERDVMGLQCRVCGEARANTCCLPCGCLSMCDGCAGRFRLQDLTGRCPFCVKPLEDFAIVS